MSLAQPDHSLEQQHSGPCNNVSADSILFSFLRSVPVRRYTFRSVNRLGEGICDTVDDSPTASREALFIAGLPGRRGAAVWAVSSERWSLERGLIRAKQFTRQSYAF